MDSVNYERMDVNDEWATVISWMDECRFMNGWILFYEWTLYMAGKTLHVNRQALIRNGQVLIMNGQALFRNR